MSKINNITISKIKEKQQPRSAISDFVSDRQKEATNIETMRLVLTRDILKIHDHPLDDFQLDIVTKVTDRLRIVGMHIDLVIKDLEKLK